MEGLVLVLDTVFALTELEGIDPIKSSFYLTRAQFLFTNKHHLSTL